MPGRLAWERSWVASGFALAPPAEHPELCAAKLEGSGGSAEASPGHGGSKESARKTNNVYYHATQRTTLHTMKSFLAKFAIAPAPHQ